MQTPGEGSSDDSSSGSETESEAEAGEPEPASQRSSQRFGGEPLTQLSSSPRKGASHLAALDQADSNDEKAADGDDDDDDDDDGSVQYSAAESEPEETGRAARRQSRVSFSQLLARSGGGRRGMSEGSSDEEEGELPPGLVAVIEPQDDVDKEALDAPITVDEDDDVAMEEEPIQNCSSPMLTNVTAPSSPIVDPSQVLPVSGQSTSPAVAAAARARSESVASSDDAPGIPPSPAGSHSSVPNWVTHTQSEPVPSSPPTTTGRQRLSNLAGVTSSSPAKPSLSEIDELDASQPPASFSRANEALDRAFALDDRPSPSTAPAATAARDSMPVAEALPPAADVAVAADANGTQETEISATQLSQRAPVGEPLSSSLGGESESQLATTSPLPSTPKVSGLAPAPTPSVQVNPPSSPTKPTVAPAPEVMAAEEEMPPVPQTPAGGRTTRSRAAKGGAAAPPPAPTTRVTRRAASQQPLQTLDASEPTEQQISASQPVGRRLRSREPSEKPTQAAVETPRATQAAVETPRATPAGRPKRGGKARQTWPILPRCVIAER